MKITNVSFRLCRYPLETPVPLSCGVLTHRNFGLVHVETDAGIDGWGETSVNFPPWVHKERRATIEEGLAGLFIGEDPLEIDRLWHKAVSATRGFTRMWSEGALMQAISGIDTALWDIAGKEYGVSVSRLMGGRHRESAKLYATGMRADEPGEAARETVEKGFDTIKVRAGFDDAKDLQTVRTVRNAVGDGVELMIDANGAWLYPHARRMLSRLAEYRPFWMEEPLVSDDREGYLRLKAEFPQIPLAWGENAFSAPEYQRFVDAYAVDFVMPDPGRSGGLTQCLRLCETADRQGIPFSPHHFGSDLGFAATLQLVAAKPLFAILLRDISHCPLREEIIETPFEIKDGSVAIPDKPGLGVSPNRKIIEKYQAE